MSEIGILEEKIWITQSGWEVPVKEMDLSHLINCINYLQKKLDKGETTIIKQYGGMGADNMDIWYDEEEVDVKDEIKAWIKVFKTEMKRRSTPPRPTRKDVF